ncbi:MAG: hypothetical protein ABSH33_22310, partial [Steroidobacteraceae bacterium]
MENQPVPPASQPPAAELPSLALFLEEAPAFRSQNVEAEVSYFANYPRWRVSLPGLALYCAHKACEDICFFDPSGTDDTISLGNDDKAHTLLRFVLYHCRHCNVTQKIFALRIFTPGNAENKPLNVMKFGEDPPNIGPASRALQDLLGDQWTLYLHGRRSELQGLGIGAFVYYRRAVERIWQRVLTRLLEVARLESAADRIASLEAAQTESRFTRSMDSAKGAVPVSLYVDGHNPFQLLYDACGDGLHEYTDDECIRRSRIIRLVLSRFAERAKAVLSEDTELRAA